MKSQIVGKEQGREIILWKSQIFTTYDNMNTQQQRMVADDRLRRIGM